MRCCHPKGCSRCAWSRCWPWGTPAAQPLNAHCHAQLCRDTALLSQFIQRRYAFEAHCAHQLNVMHPFQGILRVNYGISFSFHKRVCKNRVDMRNLRSNTDRHEEGDTLLARALCDSVGNDVDNAGVGGPLHDGRLQGLAIPHDDCCQVIDDLHRTVKYNLFVTKQVTK